MTKESKKKQQESRAGKKIEWGWEVVGDEGRGVQWKEMVQRL